MPKVLSEEQVRAFADNGFVSPVVALSPEEAGDCRAQLEAYEAEIERSAVETIHIKGHLYFDWAWRLARHPRLIGAISDLVGPDLFIMASRFWIKDPQDRKFVSWHQDHAYFGLKPPTIITAWLALNEVTCHNGCMRAIPGSHRGGTHKHVETHDKDNLLSRGQALVDVDESTAVDLVLKPGEFSIHHGHLFHSSEPNTSDDRRRLCHDVHPDPRGIDHRPARRDACLGRGSLRLLGPRSIADTRPRPRDLGVDACGGPPLPGQDAPAGCRGRAGKINYALDFATNVSFAPGLSTT